ncbi:MAG TPA: polysaccharide deacetylase family protein [Clostridia bacterium]|nr:polysaccharide deacetylase family protein [Clostridia bacterium]
MLKKRVILALFLILTSFVTTACDELAALSELIFPDPTEVVNVINTYSPAPTLQSTSESVPTSEPTAEPTATPTETLADPDATPGPYGPDDKLVAITFDDGPYPGVTNRILNIVEQYASDDVHVTFFVVGIQVVKHPSLVARAAKLGCEIGNHTYHHKNLTKLSPEEMLDEVEDVNEMVREITDASPKLVRPPYGARDDAVYAAVLYPLILWDIDTLDWSTHDAASTVEAALKCEDGDIILMHDVRSDTADAFEQIVPQLLEMGFKLVTVSQMFEAKGISLEAGQSYRHAR